MRRKLFQFKFLCLVILTLAIASSSYGATGNLSGTGSWFDTGIDPITNISWTVSWDGNANSLVHYEYTFTVNQHDISFFLLEVSDDLDIYNDIFNFSITGATATMHQTATYYGGDNPYYTMPGDITAIKFDDFSDTTSFTLSFDSTRLPEWGDFYARCGSRPEHEDPSHSAYKPWNSAWNMGFADGEGAGAGNDPTAPAGNGTINNHLLVPDTEVVGAGQAFSYSGSLVMVPEPISSALFVTGIGILAGRRFLRKRNR